MTKQKTPSPDQYARRVAKDAAQSLQHHFPDQAADLRAALADPKRKQEIVDRFHAAEFWGTRYTIETLHHFGAGMKIDGWREMNGDELYAAVRAVWSGQRHAAERGGHRCNAELVAGGTCRRMLGYLGLCRDRDAHVPVTEPPVSAELAAEGWGSYADCPMCGSLQGQPCTGIPVGWDDNGYYLHIPVLHLPHEARPGNAPPEKPFMPRKICTCNHVCPTA